MSDKTIPHYRYLLLGLFAVMGVFYVLAPLAIVILNSFSSVAHNVFPPEGYSTRWYENLFAQDTFYLAAGRSVMLALLATAIAMVIGTMASYAIVRYQPKLANLIRAFLLSPIVLPNIVLGVAAFMFVVRIGMFGNYASLLFVHVVVVLPFIVTVITASLANFDWSLQEAAMDLGAKPVRAFTKVVMPQISVSMVVSALFAFMTSFDQVETTLFLVRAGANTLPIEMFLYLQKWQDPTIAALSSLLILFAIIIVAILSLIMRNKTIPLASLQAKEASE
ncbi:ABC transporter permease [Devosia sp. MC521]|uniref:ABC transporter permease n=1 Tax=Devosia sp. MC521 TaxID=2759954 RepID=UPI0015FA32B8|nr:ABC transporter permease [Devosia sp. MC521]MBJ6986180.1 ABC transporter permease [Devosia sp. MC521]QMW64333.1 ABC transporter permease [Devosia sp. MC521]